jgi:hypothetical protein
MTRVCPKRDAICPYGDGCPYSIDQYECKKEHPIDHITNGQAQEPKQKSPAIISEWQGRGQ